MDFESTVSKYYHFGYVVLHIQSHACNFDDIQNLVLIAKRDFPDLIDENIRIYRYTKEWQGKVGIEFKTSTEKYDNETLDTMGYKFKVGSLPRYC